nr:uncharacterized protein LOC111424557 [Onthophagus taurus]
MRKAEFKLGGGLWRTMIEDVHFEKRDWAIGGISTSLERLQLADFTTMLHMESYTAFYTVSETKPEDLHGILRPFEITSWFFLILLLILVGFILGVSQRIQKNQFYTFMRIPFRNIIDQTVPRLKLNLITTRLILSVWFLASIILTTAYKSKLASTMIKPKILEPNTVIDLYNQGYSFQVNTEDWTVLKESLLNSIDKRYKDLLDRCFDDLDFCEAVKKTFNKKVAVFDEETAMPFIIFNTCRDLFGPNEMVRFRLVKQQLFPSVHAWPLRLGAPYRHRFSSTFQILISAGIVEHW